MIKVLLVEDQRLFRSGVEKLINEDPDMEVVGMAADGHGAVELVAKLQPDVVLMDIHMPNLDGINATSHIKSKFKHVKVVVLTTNADRELVIRAINVGADGFLLKELFTDNLHQAIKDAYRGQTVLSGEVASVLVDTIRELTLDVKYILKTRLENRGIQLTRRELEIANLFMQGKTNKQIAQQIHLSEGTIKNYISDLYMKLGLRNRVKVIAFLKEIVRTN